MDEEPQFLVNDFLIKDIEEMRKVLKTVNNKQPVNTERVVFFQDFTSHLVKAYYTQKQSEEVEKQRLKAELEKKKQELLEKIEQVKQKQEEIKIETPIELIKPETPAEHKDLVFSKLTKKVLVFSTIEGSSYHIEEPQMKRNELDLLITIEKKLTKEDLSDSEGLKKTIANEAQKKGVVYADELFDKIRYYLIRDNVRFGKASPLLEDPEVKEVVCEGPQKSIKIIYGDKGELTTNVKFDSLDELNAFVQHLAALTGNLVSVENPFLSASFDGFDIQATLGVEFVPARFAIIRK